MDVNSAFMNGDIKEEVYVEQSPSFECSINPTHVFKLNKALYGLKQASRAWYERLNLLLIENGFTRGQVDTTLFTQNINQDFITIQIYVDDIIFGATNKDLCQDFCTMIQDEFEMSMMGESKFFLGLQIKQETNAIYIHQKKYIKELLKKFKMDEVKEMKILKHPKTSLGVNESSAKLDIFIDK